MNDYQNILATDIRMYGINSPRSQQSRDGILGPSDLGFCRQKAALTTKGIQRTDETSIAAAQIGTAIHEYVGKAIQQAHPDWIVDNQKITATFPSGAAISGTPDIIAPDWNAIIDVKTVDGFEWVKRSGTSLNHKYQRHAYALAALQAGMLVNTNLTPLLVGNLYIDRSGKEPEPMLLIEEFDPTLTDEIDSWISDVIYAVKNGEDAMRDVAAPVCERICEFFTVCRGGLAVHEGSILIEDSGLIAAVDMYNEARGMEKTAKQMKDEASSILFGVNGTTGEWNVRWVEVQPARVEAFDKKGYQRIDIRKARK